jgi:uncharacterized membrane protein (DUF485 family)
MDFKAPVAKEQEDASVVAYNTRVGVILFAVYILFYGGFVAMSAFQHETMAQPFLAGVSLAILYGFALIIVALVLALVYMKICRHSNHTFILTCPAIVIAARSAPPTLKKGLSKAP